MSPPLLRFRMSIRKISYNPPRIRIFLFLSYSFGIETIDTFIHSVVPSKTLPDSRPKWITSISVFRPKRCENYTLWGGTELYGLYKGEPSPCDFYRWWKWRRNVQSQVIGVLLLRIDGIKGLFPAKDLGKSHTRDRETNCAIQLRHFKVSTARALGQSVRKNEKWADWKNCPKQSTEDFESKHI